MFMGEKISAWGKHVLLVGSTVLLTLGIVEIGLRFTQFQAHLPYEGMPRGYYVESRTQGYDIAKNFLASTHRFADGSYFIWSNNIGCFDTDYNGETPFIYLTGDSFAWGFAPFERKWGTILEKEIGMRVVKCGVPGYGTRQEYEKMIVTLADIPKPQAILLSYFVNDEDDDAAFPNSLVYDGMLIKNLSTDSARGYDELVKGLPRVAALAKTYCMWNEPEHPYTQRAKCFFTRHSIIYNVAKNVVKKSIPIDTLRRLGVVNNPPEERVSMDESMATASYLYLDRFWELSNKLSVPLIVVLVPPKEALLSGTPDPYIDVKEHLREKKITFLDLRDEFAKGVDGGADLYWPRDLHWNDEGNLLAGMTVSDYLVSLGVIPVTTER